MENLVMPKEYINDVQPAKKSSVPYNADKKDAIFSIFCIIMGYLHVKWLFVDFHSGIGVTLFSYIFAAGTLIYSKLKGITIPKKSWYWFAILILTATSYAIWPVYGLMHFNFLLLYFSFYYWCLSVGGVLTENKTGNMFILDILNAVIVIPFKNFSLLIKNFKGFANDENKNKSEKTKTKCKFKHIIIGLLGSIILLAVIIPMLMEADSGNFSLFINNTINIFAISFSENIKIQIVYFIISIPVSFYICGFVCGIVHKHNAKNFNDKEVKKNIYSMKKLPLISIYIMFSFICIIYIIFIAFQIEYFFSAFAGKLPKNYFNYAQYARQGFFELCKISLINLLIIVISNLFSEKIIDNKNNYNILKLFNIILSSITILIIITAFSKMILYINKYGLTQKRVIVSIFLLFLFVTFSAVIIFQFKKFNISAFSVILLTSLFCLTCCTNLNGIIAKYNTNRILEGTISYAEINDVLNLGPASYSSLEKISLNSSVSKEYIAKTKKGMERYINISNYNKGKSTDTFMYAYIRKNAE